MTLNGKALRRALNKKGKIKYMVSAWAEDNSLVLGQLKVEEESNEITALAQLLRALELSGCIVTIDAMGCQKKIAKEIKEADADFVLALKGDQETVHEEVREAAANLAFFETVEKDHGRLETRRYYQSTELDWFEDLEKWEGLKSVGMVEAIREVNGKTSTERRYYLSSLPLDVRLFARAGRGKQVALDHGRLLP